MIKNLIKSVLHIVGSENLLRPQELDIQGTKTIAELFNEEKKPENQKETTTKKISERS